MNLEQARQKLEKYGQLHVLDYYEGLTDEQKQELLKQIDETDFSVIRYAENPHGNQVRGKITPLGAMEISEIEKNKEHFTEAGLKALREQKIGAVLLAGGMGTRLGSDDPKCMYDIGITKPVYIMQRLIENLMDVVREAGVPVPLFIMTSDKNHEKTVSFMEEMDYFGYDKDMVRFFKQDMAPAVDYNGKVYMETKYRIATSSCRESPIPVLSALRWRAAARQAQRSYARSRRMRRSEPCASRTESLPSSSTTI